VGPVECKVLTHHTEYNREDEIYWSRNFLIFYRLRESSKIDLKSQQSEQNEGVDECLLDRGSQQFVPCWLVSLPKPLFRDGLVLLEERVVEIVQCEVVDVAKDKHEGVMTHSKKNEELSVR